MTGPAPTIVVVTGWGRSGSTVLNRVLAGPGVAGLGEVRWLWRRGVLGGQDCSCGLPWADCPVWGPTVRSAAGARGTSATALAEDLEHRRPAAERRAVRGRAGGAPDRAYVEALGEVYRQSAAAAGAAVVVDSSKAPAHALLARATGLPVVVLHLVRDPRAVAWSHRRAKPPPAGVRARVTPRRPTPYVAGRWLARNALVEARVHPDLRLRYEDLVADPGGAVARVRDAVEHVGGGGATAWEGDGVGSQHLIAGNPGRFDSGPLVLRPDVEWMTAQPRPARALATIVSAPLLRRYDYPWRP